MAFTKQQIRIALLKAADSIEAEAARYQFMSVTIPTNDCGTRGCALGWVGHHLGLKGDFMKVATILGYDEHARPDVPFYLHMDEECSALNGWWQLHGWRLQWRHDSAIAAKTLRKYADKHFPCSVADVD